MTDFDEERRSAVLDDVASAYASYAEGRNQRWQDEAPGSRLARSERDQWLVDSLDLRAGMRVLDVGCGDGNLARLIEDRGTRPDFVGIDLLPGRVDLAKALTPWARFEVASADRMALEDGWADRITAITMFSSVPDEVMRARIAAEINRVASPTAKIVIYDLRYPSPTNPHVRKVSRADIERLFPGWTTAARSMTVVPPIARSPLAGGRRRYAMIRSIAILRSHLGTVLTRS
jgi:ubiquinone/menaquinone biosynthesis C-methylase UbiE